MYRVWSFIAQYSILLILGAVLGLAWANLDPRELSCAGRLHPDPMAVRSGICMSPADGTATRSLTLHFLINDILMAFFFAIAGKEVWEAVALKNGALRGQKALTPLIATAGGMAGPAVIYLLGAALFGKFALLANGWAIPTATDIAFSYLVGLHRLRRRPSGGGLPAPARHCRRCRRPRHPRGLLSPGRGRAGLAASVGGGGAGGLAAGQPPAPDHGRAGQDASAGQHICPRPAGLLALSDRRGPQLVRLPDGRASTPRSACCRSSPPSRIPRSSSASSPRRKRTSPTC